MADNPEKASLRKMLLEKRDSTSFDLMKIASSQIQNKLKKIKVFRDAQKIGAYYPIGYEVPTQDIIQEMISRGKQVHLPRVVGNEIEFRKIDDFSSLEKGKFDIMEPNQRCPRDDMLDVILVPTVGISPKGVRIGYGYGFYDRFLSRCKTVSISLVLEKQMVKTIPKSEHDALIDWIVTEDRVLETQR